MASPLVTRNRYPTHGRPEHSRQKAACTFGVPRGGPFPSYLCGACLGRLRCLSKGRAGALGLSHAGARLCSLGGGRKRGTVARCPEACAQDINILPCRGSRTHERARARARARRGRCHTAESESEGAASTAAPPPREWPSTSRRGWPGNWEYPTFSAIVFGSIPIAPRLSSG